MKKLNDMKNVNSNSVSNDLLTQFVNKTHRRECLYRNTHTILGKTFQMCVLQDFETIEPNDLARTIETVEGGGLVIFTIDNESTIAAFKDIIDSPAGNKDIENDHNCFSPFYRRLIMSLSKNPECLFIDDLLNVLVCNTPNKDISPAERPDRDNYEFNELKSEYDDKKFIGSLVNCCKTVDQIKCLLKCIKSITCNPKKTTISLTAARGRGKSATLGLAAAAAIVSDNHAIYVTSPTPENLGTFFNFVIKGLEALDYQSIVDYIVTSDHNKHVVKIEIVKENKNHYVKYIDPNQEYHLEIADLLIIDEAAAIPLPVVRKLFGPYSVFLSSTVNGYEGTGRSLSMKLLNHLRKPSDTGNRKDDGRRFYDLSLNQPIRYESGDQVEKWLMSSLCLEAANFEQNLLSSPHPNDCELYYVNRDALFSHNPVSEIFLNRMISMFTTSHYKNSPNDLKIMSDNPYHHIFCLLSPTKTKDFGIREILVAIQLSFEGHLSKRSIVKGLAQNVQPAGDLIPWTISNRLNCPNFAKLSGARVVRIATHQNAQNMGYGKKAIELLKQYFECKFTSPNQEQPDDQNELQSKKMSSVLYRKLSDRKPEELDYLGVCYGLTEPLLNFWYYNSFVPLYIAGKTNDITGEHSCIMLSSLNRTVCRTDENHEQLDLPKLWYEFRSRFVNLLPIFFVDLNPSLALKVLKCKQFDSISNYDPNWSDFCSDNLKENFLFRLNDFDKNRDLFKSFADIFFLWNYDCYLQSKDVNITDLQKEILVAVALQNKSYDETATLFNLTKSEIIEELRRLFRKSLKFFRIIFEPSADSTIPNNILTVSKLTKKSKNKKNKKRKISELEEDSAAIENK